MTRMQLFLQILIFCFFSLPDQLGRAHHLCSDREWREHGQQICGQNEHGFTELCVWFLSSKKPNLTPFRRHKFYQMLSAQYILIFVFSVYIRLIKGQQKVASFGRKMSKIFFQSFQWKNACLCSLFLPLNWTQFSLFLELFFVISFSCQSG